MTYPMIMRPLLKQRVWGGRRLAKLGKLVPEDAIIGESWELADLPDADDQTTIANGPAAGRTLHEVLVTDTAALMGTASCTERGGFPLLVKYLDAAANLSVQVHPTEAYARTHAGAFLKSEAWVVLEASPGAVLYLGLQPGLNATALAEHVANGTVADVLVAVPAEVGQCYYLPSGTCHALGAGILVAEVQTPSDTTFRLFDWGRTDRPLHVTEALACVDFDARPAGSAGVTLPVASTGTRTTPLTATEHFALRRIDADEDTVLPIVPNDQPVVWMVTAGSATLEGGGETAAAETGTTILWPAALRDGRAALTSGTSLLEVTLPSRLAGMLA